ncbi:ribosomal-protein-alanine N-acetyltransferase [Lactobacillus halodurans]|uniref:Ribosomal-protein-alanine N-acetyltransferase n=2 Tax=Companilactobacillus halodurans TaxID=2584183 RepID=A0A5P0ZZI2_9LACO|nr:ribosomal-protein-alanine N-acetyltransferase [Companilactobacillus halodurans]MQS98469.1 ribosomal-protein-alanine N-acetyltransferase [Companilactobacillus halodurans]
MFLMLKKFRSFFSSKTPKFDFEEQVVTVEDQKFDLRKALPKDAIEYMKIQETIYPIPVPWPMDIVEMEIGNKKALYLSLVDGEDVIAFIGIALSDKVESHVTNLAVHVDYQKMGIGHLLMNQAFKYCRDRKFKKMSLEVDVTNKPALALYEAFGFKVKTVHKKYYFRNHHDALEMMVDL